MPDVLSRRNALLGWAIWNLAKRRLRKKLRPDGGTTRRRRVFRGIAAVAVLVALARIVARRSTGAGDTTG